MYYPDTLLIGSGNKNKVAEFKNLLAPYIKKILSLSDLTESFDEPEETGTTFYQNAEIKASYYCLRSGLATLSDDSGLCIHALNNWPGIYTKRFRAEFKTLENCYSDIEKRLSGLPHDAHMNCSLVLKYPQGHSILATGCMKGCLTFPARGHGFDVDPIFIPQGKTETFAQNPSFKQRFSHRTTAVQHLIASLHC